MLFAWKYALGYKARFYDYNGNEHTIYLLHGLYFANGMAYGAQVVLDSKTPVFSLFEREFLKVLAVIGRDR